MRDMCDRFAAEGYAVVCAGDVRPGREGCRAGLHPGGHRQGPRLPHEAGRRQGDGRRRGRRGAPRGQETRHRRLLLRRHGRLVGRDAHQQVRGVVVLVRRRHRRHQGREAELPGADAFRREGRLDPDDRRRGDPRRAAEGGKPTSTWARSTASAATNAAATASPTTNWRSSARWSSSPSISAEHPRPASYLHRPGDRHARVGRRRMQRPP